MPKEEWKPIAGTCGLYEVSNLGRIRSLDREVAHRYGRQTKRGKILEPVTRRHGELLEPDKHFVKLTLVGRSRQVRPHRLKAEYFSSDGFRYGCPARSVIK
jgi:hypothetical protein